ncbi:MAG: DUF1839 family protein [Gemmatimonadaceae bacterium]|nr:DUF1839 family protein [Gemmatimonadaceae bacterium]
MAARSDYGTQSGFVGSSRLAWRSSHAWHQGERVWSTTNAHVDVWIELLHALDLEPAPVLFPALCADFEGDQWTMPGVAATDLWATYGIAVEELRVWRPLLAHFVEQFDRGNAVLVEVDEFHLPDMIGSTYQRAHEKSVIAVTGYDRHAHTLRYIHGAFGGSVGGEDLDALLEAGIGSAQLPPTARVVKLDRLTPRSASERAQVGIALARFHATRLPARNPVRGFADALRPHSGWLSGGDAEHYQRWAFATLHQCGASFEIGADVCAWLAQHGEPVMGAVPHLRMVSQAARALHQRLVRVPQSGRMPDVSQTVDDMARSWDDAMAILRPHFAK